MNCTHNKTIRQYILTKLKSSTVRRTGCFVSFSMTMYAWLPTKLSTNKFVWLKPYTVYGTAIHEFTDIFCIDCYKVTQQEYDNILTTSTGRKWQTNII
jgi:hypothetical protein